jgi:hypothetical protein
MMDNETLTAVLVLLSSGFDVEVIEVTESD